MPILAKIGRRSLKVRILLGSMYALLLVGAVTMVYPMLLMIAGSTKTGFDVREMAVLPGFLRDDKRLYQKYEEGLFNESFDELKTDYNLDTLTLEQLDPPSNPNRAFVAEWKSFVDQANLPDYSSSLGYINVAMSRGARPHLLRQFRAQLEDKFHGDVQEMNSALQTEFLQWSAFSVPAENYTLRRSKPGTDPLDRLYSVFKMSVVSDDRYYPSLEGVFKFAFLKTQYSREIAAYNKAHGTNHASYDDVHLSRRLPAGSSDKERADWTEFARSLVNLLWLRADDAAAPVYRTFLKAKYATVDALNAKYATKYASFDEIPIVSEPPIGGIITSDWDSFIQGWKDPADGKIHIIPAEALRIHSVEFQFRDALEQKFGDVANANAALGTQWRDWMDVLPPQRDAHYLSFINRTGALRREFVTRNYWSVWDYVVRHGRAVINTIFYCALSIAAALIVNPIAAYALSRYKPPSTYKVLLFLMLTMAFPPMVTQIPVFLMLRNLGMLNTFWALILPGLANGYAIFLLKGFFDSLPQELYESAALDGAGEVRIFWQITMSLSTPILAVIALGAFTAAYSNFTFALLICQDQKMWTLMVWLYQLQTSSGAGVMFAALIIAAIPTFIVFVLCQNVIMKGIVVPVEK